MPLRPQRGEILGGGLVIAMRAPQVGGQCFAQLAVVGQQLRRVEALPAFHRMFAQHACAEAVDGEDRGQVDVEHGLAQAVAQRGGAFPAARAMRIQQRAGQRRFGTVVFAGRRIQQCQRQLQALANALAQFLRGRLGEGDREDLADAQPALDHQPRDQGGEGVGLAGAGAGLDQAHAIERQVEVGIARRAHAASSASSGRASAPMAGGGNASPAVTAP